MWPSCDSYFIGGGPWECLCRDCVTSGLGKIMIFPAQKFQCLLLWILFHTFPDHVFHPSSPCLHPAGPPVWSWTRPWARGPRSPQNLCHGSLFPCGFVWADTTRKLVKLLSLFCHHGLWYQADWALPSSATNACFLICRWCCLIARGVVRVRERCENRVQDGLSMECLLWFFHSSLLCGVSQA